ncbi:MAG: HAMP domain-containing protein [Bdellovibrionales bacterium]|nr:HAMP domain-containing protein [Bdellovibrionales bacterium]
MIKNRFLWKLCLSFTGVVLVTALVIGFLIHAQRKESLFDTIHNNLREKTAYLVPLATRFIKNPSEANRSALEQVRRGSDTRVTIILENGKVVFDSEQPAESLGNHSDRPEIIAALKTGDGMAERHSDSVNYSMLYYAKRMPLDDGGTGIVRASIPLTAVTEELQKLSRTLVFGGLFGVLLSLALGFYVAHRITSPIRQMTLVAEAMREGDYSMHLRNLPHDEIGLLGDTFNKLGTEITERITTLSKEKAQFRAMLTSMIEGVIAVNEEDEILFCNDAARKLMAAPDLGKAGKRIWEFTQLLKIREVVETVRAQGETVKREVAFLESSERKVLDVQATPFSGGGTVGVAVVFHDISELRRLERIRQDFVANASHELKTPLTAIKGYVETLIGGAIHDEKNNVRFLQKINAQADQLSAQVQDLLHLARIESGESKLDFSEIQLDTFMNEAIQLHQAPIRSKRLKLREDFGNFPVRVKADRKALAQITHNLIDNAIKYTPEAGNLTLRVRQGSGYGEVEVEDSGIGIPQKDQSRIFERFYRVDKARSREAGGTGLGLSIVKHLVQAMEGEIHVESRLHSGSRFTVRLPLSS